MNNNILVSAPLALSLGGFLGCLIISMVRFWSFVGLLYFFWWTFSCCHRDFALASWLAPGHNPDAKYSTKMLPSTSWVNPRSRQCSTSMQMMSNPTPGRSKIGQGWIP